MSLRARPSSAAPPLPAPSEAPPRTRLAVSQLRRMRRIVDAAVRLAEQGGFEGVKLRDVALASDVALGTLYKYFRSKEDILLFALDEELVRLEAAMAARLPDEASARDRVTSFFARATRVITREPRFARAVVRSMAAGDPDTAERIAGCQLRITRLIVASLRGEGPDLAAPAGAAAASEREGQIAFMLQHVWFASLVGWSAGLQTLRGIVANMRTAASLMLGEE